ncbi:organic hydroperoxide resistance protein [uncultured Planktosalinus sp.]|uniref:organic hydroperoxide resistance protein n=1 Tax=uncultured Planktosalinus sp. TaxID=1810935 RepID=UPI0030D70564
MKTLYKTAVTASGARAGHIKSDDGKIDMNLSVPKSMGGDGGDGTNPEQLFGGAYSACFGSALLAVAKDHKVVLGNFTVTANVKLSKSEEDNLNLSVVMDCYLPGQSIEMGEKLVNAAHEICPFSRATRDNIDVTLNLMLDE